MYQKGDWVLHMPRRHPMRVQRDQMGEGPDRHRVWCEWHDGVYHLEAHDETELAALPREEWPDEL